MKRAASKFLLAIVALTVSAPAVAMPNAFWIFGYGFPGRHVATANVVVQTPVVPADADRRADLPAAETSPAMSSRSDQHSGVELAAVEMPRH